MASDNLMLVRGRIATLDIYAVAFMVWAAALYLRGRPIARRRSRSGSARRRSWSRRTCCWCSCSLELLRHRRAVLREAGLALAICAGVGVAVYLAVLAVFDRIAPPYDPQTGTTIRGGPIAHTEHMFSYAAGQTSPHGPKGIASYPWDWLVDLKPINYLNVTVTTRHLADGDRPLPRADQPADPAVRACPALAARRRSPRGAGGDAVGGVAVAWFLGTWLPFVALSLFWLRTSYLYYMVIVMPGIYLAVARAVLAAGLAGALGAAAVHGARARRGGAELPVPAAAA